MRNGIGGSEEAVINMAARLAARGHVVSVHIPGSRGKRYGGVEYSSYEALRDVVFDVAIIWRRPMLIKELERFGGVGKRTYLWLHDLGVQKALMEASDEFDKVMVLSEFHRSRYPDLPAEKTMVTSNGVNMAHFGDRRPETDARLIVYGSDYDRGLVDLLRRWPKIRSAVPGARLHVFYGWQGIEHRRSDGGARLKSELYPLLDQAGVRHLGRISHRAVASEYHRAGIWAYPCSFPETSCISAMKAQVGGAVPVVIPTGALRETVQFGLRTSYGHDDHPPTTSYDELLLEWEAGLIEMLRSSSLQEAVRGEMRPASRARFDWEVIATAWEQEFYSVL
jgi:glycosyltransferase involved in cell wall biosynthesis